LDIPLLLGDTDYGTLQAGLLSDEIQIAEKGPQRRLVSGERKELGLWIIDAKFGRGL
jgi:hypothetical protein